MLIDALTQSTYIDPHRASKAARNLWPIILPPGLYDGGSTGFVVPNQFTQLIALGGPGSAILISSGKTLQITANNVSCYGIYAYTSSSSALSNGDQTTAAAWFPNSNITGCVYDSCWFDGAAANNGHRGGGIQNSIYRNCRCLTEGGPGAQQGQLNPNFRWLGGYIASKPFENCYLENSGNPGGPLIDGLEIGSGRMILYGMNGGRLWNTQVKATGTNEDALYLNNALNNGELWKNKFIATGTGNGVDGAATSQVMMHHCSMNIAESANVTNKIGTPYNVVDTDITG